MLLTFRLSFTDRLLPVLPSDMRASIREMQTRYQLSTKDQDFPTERRSPTRSTVEEGHESSHPATEPEEADEHASQVSKAQMEAMAVAEFISSRKDQHLTAAMNGKGRGQWTWEIVARTVARCSDQAELRRRRKKR